MAELPETTSSEPLDASWTADPMAAALSRTNTTTIDASGITVVADDSHLTIASIVMNVVFLLICVAWIVVAFTWPASTRLLPVSAGAIGVLAASAELIRTVRRWRRRHRTMDHVIGRQFDLELTGGVGTRRRAATFFAGFAGFCASILVLGFVLGLPLAVIAYARLASPRQSWVSSIAAAMLILALMVFVLQGLMKLRLPGPFFL